jgi:ribosomal protein S11
MQRIIFRAIVAGQAGVSGVAHGADHSTPFALTVAAPNDQFASAGTKPLAER